MESYVFFLLPTILFGYESFVCVLLLEDLSTHPRNLIRIS